MAGCGGGSLILGHLNPDLTLTHGITLSRSFSLWEPLFSHQKTGHDNPGPTYQLHGRTVCDFEYEQAL